MRKGHQFLGWESNWRPHTSIVEQLQNKGIKNDEHTIPTEDKVYQVGQLVVSKNQYETAKSLASSDCFDVKAHMPNCFKIFPLLIILI